MNQPRVAFVGIGQGYPSHAWMRRMRSMLGDCLAVAIDDCRNTRRVTKDLKPTELVPRKLSRGKRMARAIGLIDQSDSEVRSNWMLKTIRESGANCVLVHFLDYAVQFAEVWRELGIPVVVHCHGYDIVWDIRDHEKQTRLHSIDYCDQVRALPDSVWFIANSTFTRDQLLGLGLNPEKISIKRFGVPVTSEPPKLDPHRRNVLFLGRLVGFKGPVETAKAFDRIASQHRQSRLDIAGAGPLESELDRFIGCSNDANQFVRHGAVDLPQGDKLRNRAAIFTAHNQVDPITGQLEAFGVSLIEAMGQGVPVVTGRCGGFVDFIEHESNGMLFDPGDIDAHAQMLDELLRDSKKHQRLSIAAWETVRDNYRTEHEQKDLFEILNCAVETGSRKHLLIKKVA